MGLNFNKIILFAIIGLIILDSENFSQNHERDSLSELLSELKIQTNLNSNEKLCVFFIPIYECSNCEIFRKYFFDCITDTNSHNNKKYKIVGLLSALRKIELSHYIKKNKWNYPLEIEKYDFKKKLGIYRNALFCIIDFHGKVLFQYPNNNISNLSDICKKLQEIILNDL